MGRKRYRLDSSRVTSTIADHTLERGGFLMNGRPGDVDVSPTAESHDDEISLSVYFETLWRYRSIIVASVALVTMLFAIALIAFRLRSPVERVSSIQVRLLFEGAAQNRYPNGTPFSPSDIVGAPVV